MEQLIDQRNFLQKSAFVCYFQCKRRQIQLQRKTDVEKPTLFWPICSVSAKSLFSPSNLLFNPLGFFPVPLFSSHCIFVLLHFFALLSSQLAGVADLVNPGHRETGFARDDPT
jgi:hypothetical protein